MSVELFLVVNALDDPDLLQGQAGGVWVPARKGSKAGVTHPQQEGLYSWGTAL